MSPIDLFYSYAHEDEPLRDELSGHLKILERRGVIRSWHDRSIRPGQSWDAQINEQLNTADLVLLLVSSDFINSDYIWGSELQQAMQRHERGEASVVPVMVRPCLIDDAPFAAIQGLPTDLKPVTTWPNRDEAWTNVAIGIRKVVTDLQARQAEKLALRREAASREAAAIREMCAELPEGGVPRAPAPRTGTTVAPPAPKSRTTDKPRAWDAALDPLVDDVVEQTAELARSRGAAGVNRALTSQSAHTLIDAPHQPRVLWVDDLPDNNRHEVAALNKLQVEVVAVKSTDEALAALGAGGGPFDALITDWSRPEPLGDAPSAGALLLRKLRAGSHRVPVICYHGTFASALRQQRRALLLSEGAFGEAVQPDELLGLVAAALGRNRDSAWETGRAHKG